MVAPVNVVNVGKPSEVVESKKSEAQSGDKPKVARVPAQQLHNIVRTISKTGGAINDSLPIGVIEDYINEYLSAGWKLFAVLHMNEVPEGHTIMWTLVREL